MISFFSIRLSIVRSVRFSSTRKQVVLAFGLQVRLNITTNRGISVKFEASAQQINTAAYSPGESICAPAGTPRAGVYVTAAASAYGSSISYPAYTCMRREFLLVLRQMLTVYLSCCGKGREDFGPVARDTMRAD